MIAAGVPDRFESSGTRSTIGARMSGEATPTTLGRYELGALLGRGGMGSVHAAWDPHLRRRVAIKRILGAASEASRRRLHREAEALAALSHPNVVTVYEVGRDGDELFVVMELVEGESLLEWQARHTHFDRARFSAAFDLLLQAGRGLAAAHAAGILHRDVKPGNVLVGRDPQRGRDAVRVRVADFGLARALAVGDANDDRDDRNASATARQTRDGVGTPAYMSPEQIDGHVADARSDQFAFCVTAYETIWGCTPFPASNVVGRRVAIDDGPLQPPPGRGVPRGLFRVLARGLVDVPDRRYRDMDALIAALEPFVHRRSLWPLAAGGVATVGALVIAGSGEATSASVADPCARSQPLGAWWNDEARATVVDADGTRLDDGAVVRIDDAAAIYIGRFDDAWTRACEIDDAVERDVRLSCLAEHRNQVEIAADALAHDERVRIEQGAAAILQLDDPGRCNHAATSDHLDDALARELNGALARARAEAAAGRSAESLARVIAVMARAQATARPQIEARARLAVARLLGNLDDAPTALTWADAAYDLAIVAGDDVSAAGAAILALREAADLGPRPSAELRGRAEAAIARAAHDPALVIEHQTALGFFLRYRGDLDGSEAAFRRALALDDEA